ncbi:MAG: hypothetical protein ABIQ59_13525 [Nocardioidaceae bacterium]
MTFAGPPETCPCGSGSPYAGCCGPLHDGAVAETADALMRYETSRFERRGGRWLYVDGQVG